MQIYDELMALCADDQNLFYFKDQTTAMGMNVRIFNYHFVSYTDWLKPSALECRGIMFKMVDGVATEILTRPMSKFFNLTELKTPDEFAQILISQGLLSQEVYDKAKNPPSFT
ncbi:split RnlA RNA ligase 1 and tail fiber attachment catalyst [Acinetobacter phage 133]|uniref:Split RnlA RNA ligase 1 and tail fiber attachment catalyst n=1 Tax=Acinetobacter phage 133 TaxID=2919552 RepID=D9I6G2_9CAUD|nr:split RnlA RNA ligase 1 and tail fiber attachment catalyst [Acinetobacter phage 133]ADJ19543.1 split RnlA RNA ligase 1 and tail fiber attachment catalyst [Acinetobacter phage 133]